MKKTYHLSALTLVFFVFSYALLLAQASSGIKPELILYRHNSNGAGATPVISGDTLGNIWFNGLTANKTITRGANIRSFITGPVSAGILPSNLVFRTGAPNLQNRMVITSDGLVGIGTMNPQFHLHTVGNTHTSGDFYGRIHFDNNPGNQAPNTYISESYFEYKTSSALAAPDLNPAGRGGLLTLAPSSENAGEKDHQLYFNGDGIYTRREIANAANWTGAWYKLLTGEDINGTPNRVSKFTGPNSLGDSQLFDNGTNVGIGTTTPAAFLDVNGSFRAQGNSNLGGTLNVAGNSDLGGTLNVAGNSDLNAALNVAGNATLQGATAVQGATTLQSTATVNGLLTANNSAVINNTATINGTLNTNGNANFNGGKVAIGTTVGASTPGTHLLYVNGSVIATEVKVALQGNWPDYVFDPNYTLPDLCATEAFIAEHKHLPGLPSAATVQQNGGIELGEMNRILLQKIEELTLLLIDQQKQIDALKK